MNLIPIDIHSQRLGNVPRPQIIQIESELNTEIAERRAKPKKKWIVSQYFKVCVLSNAFECHLNIATSFHVPLRQPVMLHVIKRLKVYSNLYRLVSRNIVGLSAGER